MGKRSIKANKTMYQQKREELGLTREQASSRLETISPERLERLENEKITLQPRDVLELGKGYESPELCHYYCQHDCPIGEQNKRAVQLKPLMQIAVEMIASLNNADKVKMKMLDIVADGAITPNEYDDFQEIEKILEQVATSVDSLQLWIEKQKAGGNLRDLQH